MSDAAGSGARVVTGKDVDGTALPLIGPLSSWRRPSSASVVADVVEEPTARPALPHARRLGLTTVALAASGSTTLVFNLLLVRVLSPTSYGGVARTFALGMAVAQLTMAGIAPALAREVARGPDDGHRYAQALGATRVLIGLTVAVSVVFFPLAFLGLAPTSGSSLYLGWLLSVIYATYFGLKMILFALDRPIRYATLEFSSDVVFFITLGLVVAVAPTAGILAFCVAYGIFVIRATRTFKANSDGIQRMRPRRDLVGYAGWASVATYASIGRFTIAVALAGVAASSFVAGRLAALLAILMPLFLIPQAAGVLTFADVARAKTDDGAAAHVRRVCRTAGWVAALTTSIACLFGHEIVSLLIGSHYQPLTTAFFILMVSVGPQIVAIPLSNAVAAQGAVALNASFSVVAFAVMAISLPLLVGPLGLVGAAIAIAVSMLVNGCAAIAVARWRFGVTIRDIAGVTIGIGLACTAIALHVLPLGARVTLLLLGLIGGAKLAVGARKSPGEAAILGIRTDVADTSASSEVL